MLVGNHYRIWDIVHMACTTKEKVHFITKKELYKNKFLAHLCGIVEAIPVSRDGQDAKAVMTALRYLKNGEKISMFPEGTRTSEDNSVEAKTGAVRIASRMKVPIVPVYIPRRKKVFARTEVLIGEPFLVEGKTHEDYVELADGVMERIYELRDGTAG